MQRRRWDRVPLRFQADANVNANGIAGAAADVQGVDDFLLIGTLGGTAAARCACGCCLGARHGREEIGDGVLGLANASGL
jgi:hypothetical protein